MVRGIIFDYGGTLDSGGEHWSEVIWRGWTRAGVVCDKDLFRECYVHAERTLAKHPLISPDNDFYALMAKKASIELEYLASTGKANLCEKEIAVASAVIARYCHETAAGFTSQALPILQSLHKNYPIALVSNFYGNLTKVIETYQLSQCFDAVIESSLVGVRKPNPQIFKLGIDSLGIKPEETVVVGDSYTKDIEPALALGCEAIWFKGKGWNEEDEKHAYSPNITSLEQTLTLINTHNTKTQ